MRIFISILILVCYALSTSAEALYYYHGTTKVPLFPNPSKAIVVSEKTTTETVYDTPTITAIRSISCRDYDVTIIQKNDTVSITDVAKRIPAASTNITVHPCYKNEMGCDLIPTSYIYVELKSAADAIKLRSVILKNGCKIVKQNKLLPLWYTLCIPANSEDDSVEIANKIMETNFFSNAYPAFEVTSSISYDPDVLYQWGLYNPNFENIDISASEAWNYATGRGVTVAVIDTGIELTHEDLCENILPLSYDAASSSSPSTIHNIRGNGSHGTKCAGIIGAVRNNNKGIAGVSPDVKLMSISTELDGADAENQLAEGVMWAYLNGADILSCSWVATQNSPIIEQAIDNALANGRNGEGCIIVCAAGNGFLLPPVRFPANYKEEIIAVGNIRSNGVLNDSSAIGDELFICAPGTEICTTMLNNTYGNKELIGSYEYDNTGTSMSCPHVAGVIALMLELNPSLSITEVREIIATSTKKIGHAPYSITKKYGNWNKYYGYGLIDAAQAVKCTIQKKGTPLR